MPNPTRSRRTVMKRTACIGARTVPAWPAACNVRPLCESGTMAKTALQHVCRECGFQAAKWFGKCGRCGAFGSVEEELRVKGPALRALSAVLPIDQVPLAPGRRDRTGIGELDRALGGGLVPGM